MATRTIGEHCLIGFMVSSILFLSAGMAFATSWDRHIYNYSFTAMEFRTDEVHGSVWFKCPGETGNGGWRRDSCVVPPNTAIEITYTTTSGSQESLWFVDMASSGLTEHFKCASHDAPFAPVPGPWAPPTLSCGSPVGPPFKGVEVKVNDPTWADIKVLNAGPRPVPPPVICIGPGCPAPAPGTGTVYGEAVDSVTGLGVPLATITLRLNGSKSSTETTTAPGGSFQFDNLAPGDYSIVAIPNSNDYATWCAIVTVEADLADPVQMNLLKYPPDDSNQ